jgi:Holliday junction DNA helicase RuvA
VGIVLPASAPAQPDWRSQVHTGLLGLGWTTREADDAVAAVADEAGDTPDVAALLRSALRALSR